MTRHALPRAFDLARWSYCLDFVLMPPAVAMLTWLALQLDLGRGTVAGALLAGAGVWTFAEYWIHRALFHGPLTAMHDQHHRRPRAFIGVASWGTAPAFAAVWLGCVTAAGVALACAMIAGLMLGYLGYCTIHLSMHHFAGRGFGRYGAMMRRLHQGHHRGGLGNFGVSSPLWDIVFRTYRP
jgi:sterol desaturase/sphingolipid hydroxylase (fatty acid hydroxylase superfamily)